MQNLMDMTVRDAFYLSQTSKLADALWQYKHPGKTINAEDREYISWKNSLPCFLECVHNAALDDLIVVFEMKTPMSNKAIDVILVGKAKTGEDRIVIVELKQWEAIVTKKPSDATWKRNPDKVTVCGVKKKRKHPLKQLALYEKNLQNHHAGLQKSKKLGIKPIIDSIAYLHNFKSKESLYTEDYSKWKNDKDRIFGEDEKERLSTQLSRWFNNSYNGELLSVLNDYQAVLGEESLEGLKKAYNQMITHEMMQDQQPIVDFVVNRMKVQQVNPHKEIIVVSGGPGTGKTIVGIRFILEYFALQGKQSNMCDAIFCLPKSQTVKAMFDDACGDDDYDDNEYCCYLQEIAYNQNLVVVDEAHRIKDLEQTLNDVFTKKHTKLLVLLQDDRQIVRPGEEGTFVAFRKYAEANNIPFYPKAGNDAGQNPLSLVVEKRCEKKLYDGLIRLLYDNNTPETLEKVSCVEIANSIHDLESWYQLRAKNSKTKYLFPFCWEWNSKQKPEVYDIIIDSFKKRWNPEDPDEQVLWLKDNNDDRVACIYTSQGLDMDNVAFIWGHDLIWNPKKNKWIANPGASKDPKFKYFKKLGAYWEWEDADVKYSLSEDEMTALFLNTYYVMLSRARKNVCIWFSKEADQATKAHVLECFGLVQKEYKFSNQTQSFNRDVHIIGNRANMNYHKPGCKYIPYNSQKRIIFSSIAEAKNAGYHPCRACNPRSSG